MIKTVLKIGIFLVIAVLGYNYFFGTSAERKQSEEMVGRVKDLGVDAWNLLRAERDKMRAGKYDDALDKLDGLYEDLKERAQGLQDDETLERLRELDRRRKEIQENLSEDGEKISRDAKQKLDELTEDTEELMNEMEAESR